MPRLIAFLLILLCPAAATAGIRATYAVEGGGTIVVEIADNGDLSAEIDSARRLIVRDGRTVIVEERLTGPIVTRLEDLAAIADERASAPVRPPPPDLAESGAVTVHGRTGRAYGYSLQARIGQPPFLVISGDPELAPLAAAARRIFAAEYVLMRVEERWPRFVEVDGVYVSFALPDFVLVLTSINRRASISGAAPMLVVR